MNLVPIIITANNQCKCKLKFLHTEIRDSWLGSGIFINGQIAIDVFSHPQLYGGKCLLQLILHNLIGSMPNIRSKNIWPWWARCRNASNLWEPNRFFAYRNFVYANQCQSTATRKSAKVPTLAESILRCTLLFICFDSWKCI